MATAAFKLDHSALADAVHTKGGKIFAQLWYNWNAPGHWQPLAPAAPTLAPSRQ